MGETGTTAETLARTANSDSGISSCSVTSPSQPDPPNQPGTSRAMTSNGRLSLGAEKALVLRNPHTDARLAVPGTSATPPGTSPAILPGDLPPNWEARVDRHGRIFFVDHGERRTTWERPPALPAHSPPVSPPPPPPHQHAMHRRYQNMRRTVGSTTQTTAADDADDALERVTKFLQRPDFTTHLQNNERAMSIYNDSGTLRQLLFRLRKEPARLERYLGSGDLLSFLNSFADTSLPLPTGWDSRRDSSGGLFFVEHQKRRTTLLDPRLALPVLRNSTSSSARRRPRSAPAHRDSEPTDSACPQYREDVVRFLRRPDLIPLLQDRVPVIAADPKLRRKLAFVAKAGPTALARYAHDLDLISVLSAFDEEIRASLPPEAPPPPPSSSPPARTPQPTDDFETKLAAFYEQLQSRGYGQGPGKLKLHLKRENLLKDAFDQLASIPKRDLQRNKFCVVFDEEDGLDYGGPSREFFFLISRELFNPYYGLFEYSANDTYTVQISPMSTFVDDHTDWVQHHSHHPDPGHKSSGAPDPLRSVRVKHDFRW